MKKYKLSLQNISSDMYSLKEQIHMLKILFVAFVLLLPSFFYTSAAADFIENFESGDLSSWTFDGSGTFEVTTSKSVEGTHSFHRYGNIAGHDNGMHITFAPMQPQYRAYVQVKGKCCLEQKPKSNQCPKPM
jgi:hypothetical protein